jgi:adenosylmethionine---8-amino-7-oxononanoate aminotransferase
MAASEQNAGVAQKSLWYPYAQMKHLDIQYEVTHAQGVYLQMKDGRKLIDGISSWWCVIHGYNHPELNAAAFEQMQSFAHVMLGGLKHEKAQQLANKLVQITPEGLNHVFFADSGSVGMEVSMKMAVQYWMNHGLYGKNKFLALKRAYHGDTTGVMSISDPEESMHSQFGGALLKQHFVSPPQGYTNEDSVELAVVQLEQALQTFHHELAAFVVEPIMQGAGNFNLYAPLYLQKARELCSKYNVLLIFDEVATGFGRTGTLFAADQAGVTPDIMTLSKALTGGYTGMSATLATTDVFSSFYGDDASKAFMHGPTFMANATACAIALKSIEIFERENYLQKIKAIEAQLQEELLSLQAPGIKEVRVLGALGVVEVDSPAVWKGFQEHAAKQGVWLRPFDRVIYTMPPYIITPQQLSKICRAIRSWFLGE